MEPQDDKPTVVRPSEVRLTVEALARAHEAGRFHGIVLCRKTCKTILLHWRRGVVVGFLAATLGYVLAVVLWALRP